MRIAWFCALPKAVRDTSFADHDLGPALAYSWILGHLPPPPGVELHILSANRRAPHDLHAEYRGAHFHVVKVPRGGTYTMYRDWIRALKRKAGGLAPDVVHGWGTECGYGIAALKSAPRRHVVGIQGLLTLCWPYMRKSPAFVMATLNELRVLHGARRLVAESDFAAASAARHSRAVITRIPHPLREEFRGARVGERSEKVITYLGVLALRKGFHDALKAFALSGLSDWSLVCMGATGPDHAQILEDVGRLGLAGRVHFPGHVPADEIVRQFQRSPVMLLPSYIDTGPTALKEALAMGVWPVCYDNSGPRELVGRYQWGTLSPTGDVTALSTALRKAVCAAPWGDRDGVERCARRVREDMDPQVIWPQLLEVYGEIRA